MAAFGGISDLSAVCPPLGRGPEADIDYDEPTSAVDPNCRSGDGCGSITYQEGKILRGGTALFLGNSRTQDDTEAFDVDGLFRTGELGLARLRSAARSLF